MSDAAGVLDNHLAGLAGTLLPYRKVAARLGQWGGELAWRLGHGGRLLVAGNGGSAAEAQHLAAELVGKLRGDRVPLSAIVLGGDPCGLTALGNDYGFPEVFARQVRAHGRPEDVLLLMSTSGRSANLISASRAGAEIGMRCWAFTGPAPNPLADTCADVLAVPSSDPQVVQELHLVSVHVLCDYLEEALLTVLGPAGCAAPAIRPGPPAAAGPDRPAVAGPDLLGAGPNLPAADPDLLDADADLPAADPDLPAATPVPPDAEPVVPPAGVEVTVADVSDGTGPVR
ncbi:SIS domain-containing protein [Plantactinospora sp. KBS50]|uniref:D-sedoheptulose-7-phosphate isomerase n=1 Tax=Plantactinospora sp. KBS50 TaxID=2024580 RepID=UPI000BAB0606|nr:SIS domain-containing protein [Plantactinospora sp. KBS50]ASW54577.1 hypothetical protein CIK06_10855 [Plantactinospora sp. KBS50]